MGTLGSCPLRAFQAADQVRFSLPSQVWVLCIQVLSPGSLVHLNLGATSEKDQKPVLEIYSL